MKYSLYDDYDYYFYSVQTKSSCVISGLIPAVISPFVITKIGKGNALRYFLTAERFSAVEAQRIGLIQVMLRALLCYFLLRIGLIQMLFFTALYIYMYIYVCIVS